jgi:hypothetical protein
METITKYEKVNRLNNKEFKRVVGVTKDTFKLMLEVVDNYYRSQRYKGGVKKKLIIEDQILMTLEYYRHYRTYKEIGIEYCLSESNTYYTIRKIENILINDNIFHLPSLRKHLNENVIVIDVTETPIERPKKNNKNIIQERKNVTH